MTPAEMPRPIASVLVDASLETKAASAPIVVLRPAPITSANAIPTLPSAGCKPGALRHGLGRLWSRYQFVYTSARADMHTTTL